MDELERLSQEYDQISELGDEYDQEQSNSKGWRGVLADAISGAKDVPGLLKSLPGNLLSEGRGIANQARNEPGRIPKNIFAGLDKGARGLLNTPSNIANYLSSKDILNQEIAKRFPRTYDYDLSEPLGLGNPQAGDALLQGLASAAPYIMGGEAGALGGLARTGARSGAQGLHAIGQNENPVTAALSVPAIELPLRGVANVVKGNVPGKSDLFRGKLSPEELTRNVEAAAGTNTPIGNVIESPTLKSAFENITARIPGGGGDDLLANIGNQVTAKAENLVAKTGKGLAKGDLNESLKTSIDKAFKTQTEKKNQLYKPVTEIAEKEGFKLDLSGFGKKVGEKGATIESSPLMKGDSKFSSAYNKLAGAYRPKVINQSDSIVNARGLIEPEYQTPSIAEANLVKNRLNQIANQYAKSPEVAERHLASQFSDLAKALNSDIKKSIASNGSEALKAAFEKANKNYKDNFAQFLDKDVYKLLSPEKDAESIVKEIIRPGGADKYKRIEKINNMLPKDQKGLLGNAYLKGAVTKEGVVDPVKLAGLIKNLGPRQFKALFPDESARKELLDYGKLRGMNQKALTRMINPPTGYQNFLPASLAGQLGTAGALIGTGSPLLGLGALIGPQVGSKLFNKWATSENVRNKMVKKMLSKGRRKSEAKALGDKIGKKLQPALYGAKDKKRTDLGTISFNDK